MADNELEETIEQLEAEVLAELEEASADKDPQKKGATSAQKGDKVVDKVSGATQDGGAPVVDPEASGSTTDVAAKDAKTLSDIGSAVLPDGIPIWRRSLCRWWFSYNQQFLGNTMLLRRNAKTLSDIEGDVLPCKNLFCRRSLCR